MDEYDNTGRRDAGNCNCKLVPKKCIGNSKDGKLFQQKSEEKSTTVTKVTTCQLKILSLMDELEKTLKKVPKSTDPIDQFKQRKLFSDFIVRFSRNYVYEVDKIIEEIHFYQVDHYSYFERSTNHLLNKVCNLFTTIMRALQVYQKQLEKMNNESSDKLLHFTELIIIGISICVELKIFDDGDILIKLLLEKSEKFVAFLRENDNQPLAKEQEIKPPTLSTSLAKDICLPRQNRFMMYAPTSKKLKASKSSTTVSRAVSKTKVKGRSAVMNHNHPRSDELPSGNIDAMIESKVGVGSSEKSSISGNVQTNLSDFNFGCSSFNNTCNTDGTLKYINNPVVSQCGNNVSNNKKKTIAANCDTTNMLYRREVSSASNINIDNNHKIMTMLTRTGCLTLPQYQMRMLNGYNECGYVNRRSQVPDRKIQFSRNVQHLHVNYGNTNDNEIDEQSTEKKTNTQHGKNVSTAEPISESTLKLQRIFNSTQKVISEIKSDVMTAGNTFINSYVRDFLQAEFTS